MESMSLAGKDSTATSNEVNCPISKGGRASAALKYSEASYLLQCVKKLDLDHWAVPLLPNSKPEPARPHQKDQNCWGCRLSENPQHRGIEVAGSMAWGSKDLNLLSHSLWRMLSSERLPPLHPHQGTQQTLAPTDGDRGLRPTRFYSEPFEWHRRSQTTHDVAEMPASCELEGSNSTYHATYKLCDFG